MSKLISLCLCALWAVLSVAARPSYFVESFETPPRIDGDITDSVWAHVPAISDFTQVRPNEGEPASVPVWVKVAYDSQAIYFAVKYDVPIENATVARLGRDSWLGNEDSIMLTFGPFGNERDGYRFMFNALGAKRDSIVEEVAKDRPNWDGIWFLETQRNDQGWTAEGKIPVSSLSFDPSIERWEFNIRGGYAARNEEFRWTNIDRSINSASLAYAGYLEGITELKQGRGIRFKPYAVARFTANGNSDVSSFEGLGFDSGFDLFYRPMPTVTALFTVNTDFAEAEVDNRVVNLGRFPTFFPEKRAFFLEDASVFSFGGINQTPLPYFSRRIGVGPDGQSTDLLYGSKITGRVGNTQFGLLNAYVDEVGDVDAKLLSVARANVGILDESQLGIIATNGDPRSDIDNTLVGVDLKYRDSDFGPEGGSLDWYTWGQFTDTPNRDDQSFAYGWEGEYYARTWDAYHFAEFIGKDYNPALGFVRQQGIIQGSGRLTRKFYPENFDSIRIILKNFARYETEDDYLEYIRPEITLRGNRESGDFARATVGYFYEDLRESFEPLSGLEALPGTYDGLRIVGEIGSSNRRALSSSLFVRYEKYYDGWRNLFRVNVGWRPNPLFNMSLRNELTEVELNDETEWVAVQRVQANIQFSPKLIWSNVAQYDNISDRMSLNSRLRWTYRPGSNVFVIFNQGLLNDPEEGLVNQASALSMKVNATWDF